MPKPYTCAGAMAPADDRNEPDADAREFAWLLRMIDLEEEHGPIVPNGAVGGRPRGPDHDASENAKAGAVAWKAITDGQVVNALLATEGVKRRGRRKRSGET